MTEHFEDFELDDRDRRYSKVKGYPVWWARKYIKSFTEMDDERVEQLIATNHLAVFSWVTASNEPVTALLDYVYMDGKVQTMSTSNRAKYKAWSRNPAASVCIWNSANDQESVNLRGEIEIIHDRELLARHVRGVLANRLKVPLDEVPERLYESELRAFDAPDRAVMRLHVRKVVSFDGAKLWETERSGVDRWGASKE
jgi:nitroimidazol reductase NimA-like FMN-containing flavoprotein (pyridoxamine 5'-phosphate oxidase superfamily)